MQNQRQRRGPKRGPQARRRGRTPATWRQVDAAHDAELLGLPIDDVAARLARLEAAGVLRWTGRRYQVEIAA